MLDHGDHAVLLNTFSATSSDGVTTVLHAGTVCTVVSVILTAGSPIYDVNVNGKIYSVADSALGPKFKGFHWPRSRVSLIIAGCVVLIALAIILALRYNLLLPLTP